MKPFAAWLAMENTQPATNGFGGFTLAKSEAMAKSWSIGTSQPTRVLIVPDTEENRRKLGMEEV